MQVGDTPIFLAGDISGSRNILHEAVDEGMIAGTNAARLALREDAQVQRFRRRTPLNIVFSSPPVASGGIGFRELDEATVAIGEVSLKNQGRSRIEQENEGHIRVYAAKDGGRLLGFAMVGHRVEHHAHSLSWAIDAGLTVRQLLDMPFYHPVAEEGLRTALQSLIKQVKLPARSRLPLLDEDA